ncbi:MAG: Na+/H+ antiporter subunit E [Chloroflexota bacterium]|nr:Na+/H+ antiporter subunit E [Chloroflexota bacterium]MDE2885816.1 Na+/H+ antiporter subunit E [Chloroflexota bacterium]
MNREPRQVDVRPTKIRQTLRWTVQTLALFAVWFAFSGHTEIEFLVVGAVVAVLGTALTHWLFAGDQDPRFMHVPYPFLWFVRGFFRSLLYIPWLLWEILVSNLHVAYLVLHPRLPVEPNLVGFDTSLQSETAQVLLAQSITLTPGTVTVDVTDGRFIVHCLSNKSRQGMEEGSIQRKVAGIFGESAPDRVRLTDVVRVEQVLP